MNIFRCFSAKWPSLWPPFRPAFGALAFAPFLLLAGCAEMTALQSRNTQLEAEIAKLRNENGEFQKAYYQITQDRGSDASQYMSRIEKLEHEVSDARSEKSEREKTLEGQVESLTNEIHATRDATTSKLVQSDQQIAQLSATAGDAAQKAGQLDAALAALTSERDQLLKERAALRAEVEAGKQGAAAAVAEMDAIKAEVGKIRAENGDVKKQNADLKQQNADLKKQLEDLGAEAKTVAAKSADLEKAVAKADLQNDPELKAWLEAAKDRIDKNEAAAGVTYKQGRSGARVTIPSDAVFNKGTVAVADSIKPALDAVAEALKSSPDRAVRIEGHTDNQPTIDMPYADNWELGAARANQIRLYLTERGVDQNRIEVISRSFNEPISDNKTPEGRAKNRRVEIILGRKVQ